MVASPSLYIVRTGLVSSLGLTAPSSCAAMRAGVSQAGPTRFVNDQGDWIIGHQVPLATPRNGVARLAGMAALAVEEALADRPRESWSSIPFVICMAEPERPCRAADLEPSLPALLQELLHIRLAPASVHVACGRVSLAVALHTARQLMARSQEVLLVGADSLVEGPVLLHYLRAGRLLGGEVSDGFLPGEGAGAVLLSRTDAPGALACRGLGFGQEPAFIDAGEPLRGEGLTQAINGALAEAAWGMHDVHYRLADLSGEQYYFKEAALALQRTLRTRVEELDILHPAQSVGETGAVAGFAALALAHAGAMKGYAPGPRCLLHLSNDDGRRAAVLLEARGTA